MQEDEYTIHAFVPNPLIMTPVKGGRIWEYKREKNMPCRDHSIGPHALVSKKSMAQPIILKLADPTIVRAI